jgi:hypothetical protein
MTASQESLNAAAPERYIGQLPGFHSTHDRPDAGSARLSLDGLNEPVFPPAAWLESAAGSTLADHPLLRGLLMELPPKGSSPSPEWLNRWFEAARSILELIYVQGR